ncbi:MAG TPA: DNA cytosine methyltransferase [Planctomycetota bacterium]|nr:DNA cytosine methyltransferase [Planctomycetota bacterium]
MGLIVDNFAGGGGASLGIMLGCRRGVDIAINHDRNAIAMHEANHPECQHYCEDVWTVDPATVCAGREVDLAWFSPDCKHFSRAKGGKPVEKKIRGLAWVAIKWARQVRPKLIILENVREFQDWGPLGADNMPDPQRRGITFKRFIGNLRSLGYEVEHRELNAADYGAPTHRRRLFLIARCDGEAITWPEPTHGPERALPYRTAAECIDWSLPCPSIFERKRPLKENTLRRIARGLQRYVIDCADPFIVGVGGRQAQVPPRSVHEPLSTATAKNDKAIVTPYLVKLNHKYDAFRGQHAEVPLPTLTHFRAHALVAPCLVPFFGERSGQQPRARTVGEPLQTVTASNPIGMAAAYLVHMNHGDKQWSDVREPMRTVVSNNHCAEVRAFLVKYYGQGTTHDLREPIHTVTARDRFGLVTVAGVDYQIVDIGMRMLTPRELARAQGFPDSYQLTGTKSNQVARIGNSVCPPIAAAIVRANVKRARKAVVA